MRRYPTFRLDYNLNNATPRVVRLQLPEVHGLPGHAEQPRASFPGFPVAAGQTSVRMRLGASVRSTLSRNLVNEARVGYSGAPVTFFGELNRGHVHRLTRQPRRAST